MCRWGVGMYELLPAANKLYLSAFVIHIHMVYVGVCYQQIVAGVRHMYGHVDECKCTAPRLPPFFFFSVCVFVCLTLIYLTIVLAM